jgi:hypothetical protein
MSLIRHASPFAQLFHEIAANALKMRQAAICEETPVVLNLWGRAGGTRTLTPLSRKRILRPLTVVRDRPLAFTPSISCSPGTTFWSRVFAAVRLGWCHGWCHGNHEAPRSELTQ